MNPQTNKPAPDATHTAPKKPKKCRHPPRGDESVETVHQPAMPGNDMAGILDAETPFHRGFKEIAELGSNGQNRREQQKGPHFERQRWIGLVRAQHRKSRRHDNAPPPPPHRTAPPRPPT